MHDFMAGLATAGCWAVGLIFLRLWRDSGDRLFAMFAAAFWVLSGNWILLAVLAPREEHRHIFYLTRLIAFALIILGIVDKNRRRGGRHG
jgi:drug/metabolite transporter (DMT)-like permease